MTLTIIPKTKQQKKVVKAFLKSLSIGCYSEAEEDQALYKTTAKKTLTAKEKKILDNLEQSVDFVKKYKKGNTKAKSFNHC